MSRFNNKKVIAITRPSNKIDDILDIVESHGASAFIAPTLELKLSNTDSLKKLIKLAKSLDWVIFTSATSIESIFKFYPDFKEILNPKCKIATIGRKTKDMANNYNLDIDIVPLNYTAEGLLETFEDINIKNSFIGIPRTIAARNTLPDGLKKMGANVILAESYESVIPQDKTRIEVLISKLLNLEIDAITFTSPLTVKNLFKIATNDEIVELANVLSSKVLTVAIGPITKDALEEFNVDCIYPKNYTVKDMMDMLFENI